MSGIDVGLWREDGEFPYSVKTYYSALDALHLAMGQLAPDGNNCAICGDNDHQAFECQFNPLVMARTAVRRESEWRCFHCGDVFVTEESAREHFGASEHEIPACLARTDPETIAAIVESVREEEDDEQAEVLVRHLLRGAGCEDDDFECAAQESEG